MKRTCSNREILINLVKQINEELARTHGHLLQRNSDLSGLRGKQAQCWQMYVNKSIAAEVLAHRHYAPYYVNSISTTFFIVSHILL